MLKSLRIAALRVPEGGVSGGVEQGDNNHGEHSPERVNELALETGECPEEERPSAKQIGVNPEPQIFVPSVALRRSRMPTGLLDGGATHPLRVARPGEWDVATPTRVALAIGSQDLRVSAVGTVLSQDAVAPIVPLGLLVDLLGCRVSWDAGQCVVIHPSRGRLGVWLEDNCPVVSERECLELITEVEQYRANRLHQALHIRALGLGLEPPGTLAGDESWGSARDLAKWLKERFKEAPDWLLLRSLPIRRGPDVPSPYHIPGLNRRARKALLRAKHIVLHVFSGRTKAVEFALGSDVAVVNLDVLCGANLLDERVYAAALALCGTGKVDAVIGGPPCCTNSVLRERGAEGIDGGADGGPRPVRGRTGLLRFGLPTNTISEQHQVEEHTVLVTRFLTLHHVADEANAKGAMCAMENPDDPLNYLPMHRRHSEIPSIWAWPEIRDMLQASGGEVHVNGDTPEAASSGDLAFDRSVSGQWYLAQFDQGALGHSIRKPSAVLTNSWRLFQDLHEVRGPGVNSAVEYGARPLDERITASGYWSKWAPGLCGMVGRAISGWISQSKTERENEECDGNVALRVLTRREQEFRKHCEEGHMVFRRDCRACLQGQMRSHVHRRQKHHGSNMFCLSMDLVGPWKPGKDHLLGQTATRFLLASLTIPKPEDESNETPDAGNGDQGVREGREGGEGEEEISLEELEGGEHADEDLESDPSPEELDRRRRRDEERWLREAEKLQDPVATHDLIFCEPLTSKKSSEVLRAIQRIWVKILGLGLTVRRLHTDGGREFCNKQLDAWAHARDLYHTYSVPSDPKSNGRIENWVKHAKAGIRTLLCSQPQLETSHWPSALRQWAEQRLRQSLKLLHVPDPVRPLPPFGTRVMVKNRQWSRKTPHDAKAMLGQALCPAANIPNASVLLLESGSFYVAPVVYQNILDPVQFEGQLAEDIPPAPPRRVRGKTSSASVARGESRVTGIGDEGDVDSGEECVLGDADSGGVCLEGERDEFEDMVPDSLLWDEVGDEEAHVSLRNLWSAPLKCKLCETARTFNWTSDKCESCGTWQGRILTREESESEAERLLKKEGFVSRCDLNHLLAISLSDWTATSRSCDRAAARLGSSGLTLGLYVYGSKVGLTKECLQRPNLTKLLNLYLRQNACQATWSALRVTCNFEASPHQDRNFPGSLNMVVPISWFGEGKIWVEGDPPEGHRSPATEKEYRGKRLKGYHIGGAHEIAQFDPTKPHAVEPSVGDRRVAVAYSPRLINRLTPCELDKLRDLGFNLPVAPQAEQETDSNITNTTSKAKGGDRQEHGGGVIENKGRKEGSTLTTTGEEDHQAGFSPGGAGSNARGWEIQESLDPESLDEVHREFVKMRQLEIECRKLLDEQLELVLESGGIMTCHVKTPSCHMS